MEIDIPALVIAGVVTVVWLVHILLTLANPEFGHNVRRDDRKFLYSSESDDSDDQVEEEDEVVVG